GPELHGRQRKVIESLSASPSDPLAQGYRLRRATLLDIRAVHRLEQVIFPRDAYPYFDLFMLFVWPRVINLKVAAPDGSLAGFVSAVRVPLRDRAWIITLGVDPAHQHRGIGRLLLETSEKRLNVPCVRLTVRDGNTPAMTLYRHAGYTVIERKFGYYRDGETGLVMEKLLPES
ncbi:MAG: GNAT family N-acetyltransferase, partial [Anaerolineae bacterium]|nr:GNAT family N-acetyltransferase [Anaerolineae bacterium]